MEAASTHRASRRSAAPHRKPPRFGADGASARSAIMLGLVPRIHVLNTAGGQRRRGWSPQGRPWRRRARRRPLNPPSSPSLYQVFSFACGIRGEVAGGAGAPGLLGLDDARRGWAR